MQLTQHAVTLTLAALWPNSCSAPHAPETRFIASLPSLDGTKCSWQPLPLSKIRYNQMEESQQHFNL
jgi:hypothetical protein